ncbi:hypothetical protein ERJ75_000873500 [Trypanosoma vivax]|nr:hypothetical protein ERJ75_000873500 [Trypanosoma vivax]
MALFLRFAFILVLLGTVVLGDGHAKDVAGTSSEVEEGAVSKGASKTAASIQPRSFVLGCGSAGGLSREPWGKKRDMREKPRPQPRALGAIAPGGNCSIPSTPDCNRTNVSCEVGAVGECPEALPSASPQEPGSASRESEDENLGDTVDDTEGEEEEDEEEEEEKDEDEESKNAKTDCQLQQDEKCKKGETSQISKEPETKDKNQESELKAPPQQQPAVGNGGLERSDPHGNQNTNQQGQNNGTTGHSQSQVNQLTSGIPETPKKPETEPAVPESISSSSNKNVAKGKKESTPSADQKHDSVTNGESVKGDASESEVINDAAEKHGGADEAKGEADGQGGSSNSSGGQHSGQGAAEVSSALFHERTSVVLLLAVLSRFCALEC